MKKLLSIMLTLTLLFSVTIPVAAAEDVNITIFHLNDTHSRIETGDYDGMGFDKVATIVKEARDAGENVLLLDAGDTFHGQTFATISEGASVARVMNLMAYDALAAGNHDFNYGQERLLALQSETDFPILGANVLKDGKAILDEYIIKEIDGIKIGIFGLSTPETSYKTHPLNVEGITFEDPKVTAARLVETLEPMVDVIIALGHLGDEGLYTSKSVCEAVDGIDLFVDGHSHTIINEVVNNTLIVQTGEYDKNLGKVNLTYSNGEVTVTASLITKEDATDVVPDPEVKALIDSIKLENEVITSVVVGTTTIDLQGEREFVRTGETNLGNLITESMLDVSGADIAITNGGGIRASIPTGDITQGDIITVLPFGNYVVTKDVTGADIKAILEVGISDYPNAKGGFPHIAGMTITFDPNLPAGERLVDVMVGDTMLDDTATYTLVTNDFLAAGGDDYTAIKEQPVKGEFDALDEVVVAFLNANGTDKAAVTGRVTALPIIETEDVPDVAEEVAEDEAEDVEVEVITVVVEAPTYTVKAGDFLWKIAQSVDLTWQELAEYNQLSNPNLIFPGDVLMIPAK